MWETYIEQCKQVVEPFKKGNDAGEENKNCW